jgi:hypothetical protein
MFDRKNITNNFYFIGDKFMALNEQELLDKIAIIAAANPSDPTIPAEVAALNAAVAGNAAAITANSELDVATREHLAVLERVVPALVDALAKAGAVVPEPTPNPVTPVEPVEPAPAPAEPEAEPVVDGASVGEITPVEPTNTPAQ